jgi:integrase
MPTEKLGLITRQNNGVPSAYAAALKKPGKHNDGGLLYLNVTDDLTSSWVFRYRDGSMRLDKKGKPVPQERWIGLGATSSISLAAVRKKAQQLREAMRDGRDPRIERQALEPIPTFDVVLDRFLKTHPYWESWRAMFQNHASPTIGTMPIDTITTQHVMNFLEPLWSTRTKTARRLRQRIEKLFDAAIEWKYRKDNPAPRRLSAVLPNVKKITTTEHMSAMPWQDVPAFVRELRQRDSVEALALEFTVLTIPRSGDVLGRRRKGYPEKPPIHFEHVDFDEHVWTVGKTKTGKEFRVHLSKRAMEILETLRATQLHPTLVFPSSQQPSGMAKRKKSDKPKRTRGANLGQNALLNLLNAMTGSKYDVHGFRTSFRTWVDQATNYDHEVAETVLSHAIPGDETRVAYRQHDWLDQRAALVDHWAAFVEGAVEMQPITRRRTKLALVENEAA